MKTKNKSIASLVTELDNAISKYVRINAADSEGRCQCVSCPRKLYWQLMDCAHFVDRRHMATRFYLPNLAPACKDCNRHDPEGHKARWAAVISGKKLIELVARERSMMKWTAFELHELIKFYNAETAKIRKEKKL